MNEIFKRRHSVRSFQARNVSRRELEAVLAAADSAPSAGGLKSREVSVVTDDVTKKRLVEAAHGQEFVAQAPVVIVFWAVPSRSAGKYGATGRDPLCAAGCDHRGKFRIVASRSVGSRRMLGGGLRRRSCKEHLSREDRTRLASDCAAGWLCRGIMSEDNRSAERHWRITTAELGH